MPLDKNREETLSRNKISTEKVGFQGRPELGQRGGRSHFFLGEN